MALKRMRLLLIYLATGAQLWYDLHVKPRANRECASEPADCGESSCDLAADIAA